MSNEETGTEVATSTGSNFAVTKMEPKDLADVIKENIGAELNIFDLEKLKIPSSGGTHWSISTLQGDEMVKHVDGVLIYFQDIRGYWKDNFEDNPGQPPTCSSTDCLNGEGDPGGDCQKCAFAQFGSAEKGDGQACTQSRRMFMLTEGSLLPIMLTIPPTSLKNARKYFIKLAGYNVPFHSVLTRVKLTTDKSSTGVEYSKVEFETVGQLGKDEHEKVCAYRDSMNGALGAIPIDYQDMQDSDESQPERS